MSRIAFENKAVSNSLSFWTEYSSWTYCAQCSSVHRRKLFQRHANPKNKHETACPCTQNQYVVPLFSLIPDWLKVLTFSEVCLLRPLKFHYGDYERMQHGYRQKNGMCHVTWENVTVEEALAVLQDEHSKRRCQQAYNFLINSSRSSYKAFIEKHNTALETNDKINL